MNRYIELHQGQDKQAAVSFSTAHIALTVNGLQQPVLHLLRGCWDRCHCLFAAIRGDGGRNPPKRQPGDNVVSEADSGTHRATEQHIFCSMRGGRLRLSHME